ncbi:Dynein light chain, type 1/2 [Corchorus capsularis]|uniref:Dynein light chain n=1 Tax=Corchorus capsularis TaxID=210143 RepID=A0A1R3IZJ3_COCAP|nr:Dynein light chain, type 1/2 [Corchorus capsularis]
MGGRVVGRVRLHVTVRGIFKGGCSSITSLISEKKGDMLEGKAMVKETDMSENMQSQAMAFASQALDFYDVSDCVSIAAHIKKEFDKKYGGGWQCVVVGKTQAQEMMN